MLIITASTSKSATRAASSQPSEPDVVVHRVFDCAKCGPVLTIVENRSEETAEVIEIDYLRTIARISRVMAAG